jgi:uncharacterized protein (TIGR02145 family)
MTGLTPNTKYYVRAYATNQMGTGYGDTVSFTSFPDTTVTDIDGNVYKTIKIGNQIWMAENLKTTKYHNGEPIPNITDNTTWYHLTSGAYCNYNNNSSYVLTYGRLYNWYAVNDNKGLAPEGWHIPSDAEWITLINYLGGVNVAGGKLKESGIVHWQNPNTGATNVSGFTALPGGFRGLGGAFGDIGVSAYIWSATEDNMNKAWFYHMNYSYSMIDRINYDKYHGFSVRCIKD